MLTLFLLAPMPCGEFDPLVPFDQAAFDLFSLQGVQLVDANKPPENHAPRTTRQAQAQMAATSLEIPACPDCPFKLFFGNPGGVPACDPPYPAGDCDDGIDPRVDPLDSTTDPAHELEFRLDINGTEVPAFIEDTWYDRVNGATVIHNSPSPPQPVDFATIDPADGRVVFHGSVVAGDVLEIQVDRIVDLLTVNIQQGSLVLQTNIVAMIDQAQNERDYYYPPGQGHSISDLNAEWYVNYQGDPRSEISGNTSERIWRLDQDGNAVDPKFDTAAQYIWAQAMGTYQFQVWQLIGTQWGIDHLQELRDESGTPIFDLDDPSRSLPVLLSDFSVVLELYRNFLRYKPNIPYLANPCQDANNGFRCTNQDWDDYIEAILYRYNGDTAYPAEVIQWLRGTPDGGRTIDFSGNVPY